MFGLITGWAYYHAYAQDDEAKSNGSQAVKILVQPVKMTANDKVFEAVGTGRAQFSADIYPSVAEKVVAVNFEAQQEVVKGDILVQLDDRPEKLAVELAEVELKDAQTLFERYENVAREGAVPRSERDTARATYETALLALEQAKLDLEERKIIAPFDGVVGIPNIDPGDRVDGTTLITGLDDRDIIFVDFEVPEALAGALDVAQREKSIIQVSTPSYPAKVFDGHITAQESRVNPQTRTLTARVSIVNNQDLLRPGMSFTARWIIKGDVYPTVPEISVQWGRDGSFVWIIRDNKAQRIMTRVVARKAGQVLLDGDIKENDQVVVEGLQRLRPDATVKIINAVPSEELRQ